MVANVAALAALAIQGTTQGTGGTGLVFGTVTSAPAPLQVTIDGADTPVTAQCGRRLAPMLKSAFYTANPSTVSHAAIGARVVGVRIGSQFYITDVLSGGLVLGEVVEYRSQATTAVSGEVDPIAGWGIQYGTAGDYLDSIGSTQSGQIQMRYSGMYLVHAGLGFNSQANARLGVRIYHNNVMLAQQDIGAPTTGRTLETEVNYPVYLAAGDTVHVGAYGAGGSSIALAAQGQGHTFSLVRLGDPQVG